MTGTEISDSSSFSHFYKMVFLNIKTNKLVTLEKEWLSYTMFPYMEQRYERIMDRHYKINHQRKVKATKTKYEK